MGLSLRSQKTFINQPLSKHWYIVQICTIRKSTIQICTIRQEIEKRIYNLLQKNKKNQTSQTLRHSLDILDIGTQLNFLKIKLIQKLLNPTHALWKDLMLYSLNIDLILNSSQGLAIFRQKQILRYNRYKNLQKQNNEDFFI